MENPKNKLKKFFVNEKNKVPNNEILKVLNIILKSKKPLILVGGGIKRSKQENNFINNNWTRRWSEFLTYWVNDSGVVKIENFVQLGLVKYESCGWLNDESLTNLKN